MNQITHHTNCRQVPELLPWYLNGSLVEDEARLVESHLAECESCRCELEETVDVWQMVDTHIPSLALAEYAQGLMPQSMDREAIEQHLAVCSSCREEFEMAMPATDMDHQVAEVVDFAAAKPERTAFSEGWRRFAVAASITAVATTGAMVWNLAGPDAPVVQPQESMAAKPVPTEEPQSGLLFESGFENMDGWTIVTGEPSDDPLKN